MISLRSWRSAIAETSARFGEAIPGDGTEFLRNARAQAKLTDTERHDAKTLATRDALAVFVTAAKFPPFQGLEALHFAITWALVRASLADDGWSLSIDNNDSIALWMGAVDHPEGEPYDAAPFVAAVQRGLTRRTRSNPTAGELARSAGRGVGRAARWAAPRARAAAVATGKATVRAARWAAPRAKAAAVATGKAAVRGAKAAGAAARRGAKRAAPHVARGLHGAAGRLEAWSKKNPGCRWVWRSGGYQCGCRHTTQAAAEACARRHIAQGVVHLVCVP